MDELANLNVALKAGSKTATPSNVPLNDIYMSALEPLSYERIAPSDPCSSHLRERSTSNREKSVNKRSSR